MKSNITETRIEYQANSAFDYIDGERKFQDSGRKQHSHDGYEIIVIISGAGHCILGGHIFEYSAGDVLMFGVDVPHNFLFNSMDTSAETGRNQGKILHFQKHVFPMNMKSIAEFRSIHSLLQRSRHGIVFRNDATHQETRENLIRLNNAKGIERILYLFTILDSLGRKKHFELISQVAYIQNASTNRVQESWQRVYEYLYSHFQENITLKSLAKYAGQNATALCRIFKQRTGKTIFAQLNKIRITFACDMLVSSRMEIAQIAFQAGYSSLAHFNKQFKLYTKQTPTEYRKVALA